MLQHVLRAFWSDTNTHTHAHTGITPLYGLIERLFRVHQGIVPMNAETKTFGVSCCTSLTCSSMRGLAHGTWGAK